MGRRSKVDSYDPWEIAKSSKSQVRRTLSQEDKKYCEKCVYRGSFSAEYLCNFLGIVGHSRGCPSGVGCTQRRTDPIIKPEHFNPVPVYSQHPLEKLPKNRVKLKCNRCGESFIGTKKAKYCSKCRILQLQDGHDRWEKQKNVEMDKDGEIE